MMTILAGPCDSPAVVIRNTLPKLLPAIKVTPYYAPLLATRQ